MGSSLYLLRVKSAVADSGIAIAVGLLLMCILSAVIVSTGVITPVSNYSPTVLLSDDATESPSETEAPHHSKQMTSMREFLTPLRPTRQGNNSETNMPIHLAQ